MAKTIAVTLLTLALASTGLAQDMPGALNLPDLARTQTQSSAM